MGAIIAILIVYAAKLIAVFAAAPHDPAARRFILSVLIAFLPAVVVGVLAHDVIKTVLFETPMLIAVMLILGGIVLLFVDRMAVSPKYDDAMHFPMPMALTIGVIQCLAMIPGVSRSGATIVGALLMGADKRSAAEFSFYLSMPTMAGAFAYDLFKNRAVLDLERRHRNRHWFCGGVRRGDIGRARAAGLCKSSWLFGFWLVANYRRIGCRNCADVGILTVKS